MSEETSERQFAFGRNEYDGYECPAVAAGYSPGDPSKDVTEVARIYDKQVRELHLKENAKYRTNGTVDLYFAKKAWDNTIEKFGTGTIWWHLAVDVAEQLGWR